MSRDTEVDETHSASYGDIEFSATAQFSKGRDPDALLISIKDVQAYRGKRDDDPVEIFLGRKQLIDCLESIGILKGNAYNGGSIP